MFIELVKTNGAMLLTSSGEAGRMLCPVLGANASILLGNLAAAAEIGETEVTIEDMAKAMNTRPHKVEEGLKRLADFGWAKIEGEGEDRKIAIEEHVNPPRVSTRENRFPNFLENRFQKMLEEATRVAEMNRALDQEGVGIA